MAQNLTVPPPQQQKASPEASRRMAQIFKDYEGPKFGLLSSNRKPIQQVDIAVANKETSFYVCYELDKKFYYVDYNPALKLSLDKKVLNLAKPQYNGAILEYQGNLYTKTGHLLIEQSRLTRVGDTFYYPDVNAKKLNVSEFKKGNAENFFENKEGLYEKKGELYFDYLDNKKIYNAQGELLRPIQNQFIVSYYPFDKPTGDNSRYSAGVGVNPQESPQAFYVRMKDAFWDKAGMQENIQVSLNINSPDGKFSNRLDVVLKRQADGTFLSEPLALSHLQAEPGDRLTLSYSTLEGKMVTVPLGSMTVDKVVEVDLFVPIDANTGYSLAKAQEQIDYLKQEMGLHGIQVKVNTFAVDKTDVDINKLGRVDIPARLTEKFPQSKGIKMIMTPGQDNQGIVLLEDNARDPKARNSFFVAPEGHPQRKLTDDYTLKAFVKIATGLDIDMYNTKKEFVLTPEMVEKVKQSSLAQSSEVKVSVPQTTQPALTP